MRTDISAYNWTSNRVNPESDDFKNVMKWLGDHGAPYPQVVEVPLDPTGWATAFPSGAFPGTIIMLAFPGDPLLHDAAGVLNSPGVLLKELGIVPNDLNYTSPVVETPKPPVSSHIGQHLWKNKYAQVDPDTDPAQDGDEVTGPDGGNYRFIKGMIGGWYEQVI